MEGGFVPLTPGHLQPFLLSQLEGTQLARLGGARAANSKPHSVQGSLPTTPNHPGQRSPGPLLRNPAAPGCNWEVPVSVAQILTITYT